MKTVFASTHAKMQKSPQSILQQGEERLWGFSNAAFIETEEIHASRNAAAMRFQNACVDCFSAHRHIDLRRITGVYLKIAFLIIVAIAAAGEPFRKNVLPQILDCLHVILICVKNKTISSCDQ